MASVTRQQIFSQAAKKLRQEFSELSTVPHSALKGHETEKLVRMFLSTHIPKRFDVGSGFIIDATDQISKQSDIVVYDAFNCPLYRASEDAAIFPSDNVAAVVEVKSRLDKEKLEEAAENIAAAKSLAKAKPPNLPFLMTTQTMGCVFAFETPLKLEKLTSHYASVVRKRGLGRHIDAILVLDRALLTIAAKAGAQTGLLGWNPMIMEGFGGPATEGAHIAVGAQNLEEDSLDAFFRILLSHLIFFRPHVGHPGFGWPNMSSKGKVLLEYICSLTHEQDPAKRKAKLEEYARQAIEELKRASAQPK